MRSGRIVEVVESRHFQQPDVVLGGSVLAPGLINAHTHLEFSLLGQPFSAGRTFPSWISQVVAYRRSVLDPAAELPVSEYFRQAYRAGMLEACATGTSLLADICSMPWQPQYLPSAAELCGAVRDIAGAIRGVGNSEWQLAAARHFPAWPAQVIALPEVIGLTSDRFQDTCRWARECVGTGDLPDTLRAFGVSPHAPYSIEGHGLERFLEHPLASPLAIHLAESRDEIQWLAEGQGAFYDSFARLGFPTDGSRLQIDTVLELMAELHRGLVVHGNYLTAAQCSWIGQHPNLSVVYCPRTHAHFGHEPYPLQLLLDSGCRLALGTDSRASNPDLNLWLEVVEARRRHPELSPQLALASVTSAAAEALGVEQELGTLAPGKLACVIQANCGVDWTVETLLDELTSCDPGWAPLQAQIAAS